jgi:hypothetical protein
MSRWFRTYADTHRNSKIARLSDREFRQWHQLLCIASENDGLIPPAEDLKHLLRMRLDHCSTLLSRFQSGGLLDALEGGYAPHNWNKRQYKSDTSTDRVQKYRAKRNVSGNVSGTPPDTEAETDTEKEEVIPGKPGAYAFFGKTIKLAPRHFEEWARLFHTIHDLQAELSVLDEYWQTQPAEKRPNWFLATKGMLNKKHQTNMGVEKQALAAPTWDGMP